MWDTLITVLVVCEHIIILVLNFMLTKERENVYECTKTPPKKQSKE